MNKIDLILIKLNEFIRIEQDKIFRAGTKMEAQFIQTKISVLTQIINMINEIKETK